MGSHKLIVDSSRMLISNLQALIKTTGISQADLAAKSRISPRYIGYILAHEKIPTVRMVDALARVFGLEGWQLLVPELPTDLAANGKLARLVQNYMKSPAAARDYINHVAEQEAKYLTEK